MRSNLSRTWEWIRTLHHPSKAVLVEFLDHELDPARHVTVGAHVSNCGFCRSRLEQLQDALQSFNGVFRSSSRDLSIDAGWNRLELAMKQASAATPPAPQASAALYAPLLTELSIYLGRHAAMQLLDRCDQSLLQRDSLNAAVRPTISAFLGERTASAVLANVLRIWDRSHPAAT